MTVQSCGSGAHRRAHDRNRHTPLGGGKSQRDRRAQCEAPWPRDALIPAYARHARHARYARREGQFCITTSSVEFHHALVSDLQCGGILPRGRFVGQVFASDGSATQETAPRQARASLARHDGAPLSRTRLCAEIFSTAKAVGGISPSTRARRHARVQNRPVNRRQGQGGRGASSWGSTRRL